MIPLIRDLWFKRRDIISDGFDESLEYISKIIPLKIYEIPTGKRCWTWTIPKKWTVKEAWIKNSKGKILLHNKDHPLHVLTYSRPVDKTVTHQELMKHLMFDKKRPNSIPYHEKLIYRNDWGFSIQFEKLKEFRSKNYHVFIDSKFEDGSLKVGEINIPGEVEDTIVIVAHLDHPCMVNDDLTGVVGLVEVAKKLKERKNHFTYRLFLLPETIGSIAFLSTNEEIVSKIKYGIFLEMLGTKSNLIFQHTKQGDTMIDRIAKYVVNKELKKYKEVPFIGIMANDEQVWNGPGIDIPMIAIGRGHYPQYHTSDDTPKIISERNIWQCIDIVMKIINVLDSNYTPKRKFIGPVFLSGVGLYIDKTSGDPKDAYKFRRMLNYFEGDKTVFDISQLIDVDFEKALSWANMFLEKELIEKN